MKKEKNSEATLGEIPNELSKISRRRWMGIAAGAAASIPFAAAGLTAKTGPVDGAPYFKAISSRVNAHARLEYEPWLSVNRLSVKGKSADQHGWSHLSSHINRDVTLGLQGASVASLKEYASRYVERMDEAGIRVSCLNIRDRELEGGFRTSYLNVLQQVASMRDAYPDRFILFCGIDPNRGSAGVDLLEHAVKRLGYRGLGEILPHIHRFSPDDKDLCYSLYEKAAKLQIPVSANLTSLPNRSLGLVYSPQRFDQVSQDFPGLNICLSSAGFPYWIDSAFKLAESRPGIFIDTADWVTTDKRAIARSLGFLRRALDGGARYKIMYGGDTADPNQQKMGRWADLLVKDAPKYGFTFTTEELRLYFVDNFKTYLNGTNL